MCCQNSTNPDLPVSYCNLESIVYTGPIINAECNAASSADLLLANEIADILNPSLVNIPS